MNTINDSREENQGNAVFYELGSLQQLWQEYTPDHKRWLTYRGVPQDEVDDILLDCYLKLHERALKSQKDSSESGIFVKRTPEAYLFAIVRNAYRDWLQRHGREKQWDSIDELEAVADVNGDPVQEVMEKTVDAARLRVFNITKRVGEWLLSVQLDEYKFEKRDWELFLEYIDGEPLDIIIPKYAELNKLSVTDARCRLYETARALRRFIIELAQCDPQIQADLSLLGLLP